MKYVAVLLVSFFCMSAQADYVTFEQVVPVLINNCASCHNSSTPNMNWLDQDLLDSNKFKVYNRVYVEGDMPFWFKYFGGEERDLLKKYLEQPSKGM